MQAFQAAFGSEIITLNNQKHMEKINQLKWTDQAIHQLLTTALFTKSLLTKTLSKIKAIAGINKIMKCTIVVLQIISGTKLNGIPVFTRIGFDKGFNPSYFFNRCQAAAKFSANFHSKLPLPRRSRSPFSTLCSRPIERVKQNIPFQRKFL